MAEQNIEKGDQVSWQWGSGAPSGTVAEVAKEGEIAIESKRGNTIKKNADPENPAVHVERSGNDVVKRASELDVEEKADGNTGGEGKKDDEEPAKGERADQDEELKGKEEDSTAGAEKDEDSVMKGANGEEKSAGEKRSKEEQENGEKAGGDADGEEEEEKEDEAEEEQEPAAKKQKTGRANGAAEKKTGKGGKAGRPKKSDAPAKPKKAPKKAATASGEPRRSARNK